VRNIGARLEEDPHGEQTSAALGGAARAVRRPNERIYIFPTFGLSRQTLTI